MCQVNNALRFRVVDLSGVFNMSSSCENGTVVVTIPQAIDTIYRQLSRLEQRVYGSNGPPSNLEISISEKLGAVEDQLKNLVENRDSIEHVMKKSGDLHKLLGPLNEEKIPDAVKMSLVLSETDNLRETGTVLTKLQQEMQETKEKNAEREAVLKEAIRLAPDVSDAREEQRELAMEVTALRTELIVLTDKVNQMANTLSQLLIQWGQCFVDPENGPSRLQNWVIARLSGLESKEHQLTSRMVSSSAGTVNVGFDNLSQGPLPAANDQSPLMVNEASVSMLVDINCTFRLR
ncbi:unnamed protein product [Cyprideis torosa]|uniref:Uncharacterized protein n=1 Tax=Cyprideis torosa TaxID=163714 RepID=A0A7R8ZPJ5_9CRUS|nr:unnamed protein product [Cyprideis torosa]CAG0890021.1 unnamed protein product [Cyprideis torosa]